MTCNAGPCFRTGDKCIRVACWPQLLEAVRCYKLTSRSMLLNPELFGVRNAEVVCRLTNRYHLFSDSDALTVDIPIIGPDAKPDSKGAVEKFGPLSINRERNRIKTNFII